MHWFHAFFRNLNIFWTYFFRKSKIPFCTFAFLNFSPLFSHLLFTIFRSKPAKYFWRWNWEEKFYPYRVSFIFSPQKEKNFAKTISVPNALIFILLSQSAENWVDNKNSVYQSESDLFSKLYRLTNTRVITKKNRYIRLNGD